MTLRPEALRLIRSLLEQHADRMRQELCRPDLTDMGRAYMEAEARLATEAAAEIEAEGLAR